MNLEQLAREQQETCNNLRERNRGALRQGTLTQRMSDQLNRADDRLTQLTTSAGLTLNRSGRLE